MIDHDIYVHLLHLIYLSFAFVKGVKCGSGSDFISKMSRPEAQAPAEIVRKILRIV